MGSCSSGICGSEDTADTSGLVADRTIKVTGISLYLKHVFVNYFQQGNELGPARKIEKVFVCPNDTDCVFVQFPIDQDMIPNRSVQVNVDGIPLTVEPYTFAKDDVNNTAVEHNFADENSNKIDGDQKRADKERPLNEFDKYRSTTITVRALLFHYIRTFHWEVYQELENVCKEINFKMLDANDRTLQIIARDDVDTDLFNKKYEQFISCYQQLYQTMHQEVITVKSNSSTNASIRGIVSDTRAKFSVIVTFCQETSQITVFGEKSVVLKACSSINGKVSAVSNGSKNIEMPDLNGQFVHKLSEKVKLIVYQGDIAEENADAIVNPANEDLRHRGGAAEAILKRGGKIIQDESDDIMKLRRRPLQPGDVEITTGGKLPCKFVVHAVGPRWSNHSEVECRRLLQKAVGNSLKIASQNLAQTIALPAISSGLFGVPVKICAEVLFETVEEFAKAPADLEKVQEIRFVNIDRETNQVFQKEMRKRHGDVVSEGKGENNQNGHFMINGGTNTSMGRHTNELSQQSVAREKERGPATQQQNYYIRGDGRNNTMPGGQHFQPNPSTSATKVTFMRSQSFSNALRKDLKNPSDNDAAIDTSRCPICLEGMTNPKALPKCGHSFCTECIDNAFKHQQKCPLCGEVYGVLTGNQPPGQMRTSTWNNYLPGFEGSGTIIIHYSFHNGTQGPNHPNPGHPYTGTRRMAYLPNNKEGQKVHKLLKKAFDQKLTFTIGRSSTTGRENTVTWNDIHHKTSTSGGPAKFGYPDPSYLQRVQEELAAKGIKE